MSLQEHRHRDPVERLSNSWRNRRCSLLCYFDAVAYVWKNPLCTCIIYSVKAEPYEKTMFVYRRAGGSASSRKTRPTCCKTLPSTVEPRHKGGGCADGSSALYPMLHLRSHELALARSFAGVQEKTSFISGLRASKA